MTSKRKRYSVEFKAKVALEALQQTLAPALDTITAQNAAAFFRHCGYAYPN